MGWRRVLMTWRGAGFKVPMIRRSVVALGKTIGNEGLAFSLQFAIIMNYDVAKRGFNEHAYCPAGAIPASGRPTAGHDSGARTPGRRMDRRSPADPKPGHLAD